MVYGWLSLFMVANAFQGSVLPLMLYFKNVEILQNHICTVHLYQCEKLFLDNYIYPIPPKIIKL